MANEANLKPASLQSKSEARANGSKGGIASGESRRAKKMLRETFETLLNMPLNDEQLEDIEQLQSIAAAKGKNITVQQAICIAMIQKALKGDVKAAEYVRDTMGQNPKHMVEVSGNINNPFAELTTEELRKLVQDD